MEWSHPRCSLLWPYPSGTGQGHPCPLKPEQQAHPLREQPYPWACGGSGSPDGLWITFSIILPFSWGIVHVHNWIAIWSHLIESKKSNSIPSPCPTFSLVQTGSVSAGISPSLLMPSAVRWLIKSMNPTHDLLIKWLFSHTLGILSRRSFLIFLQNGQAKNFPNLQVKVKWGQKGTALIQLD